MVVTTAMITGVVHGVGANTPKSSWASSTVNSPSRMDVLRIQLGVISRQLLPFNRGDRSTTGTSQRAPAKARQAISKAEIHIPQDVAIDLVAR